MNKSEIQKFLKNELAKDEGFDNWHGINKNNLYDHLVEPYLVTVYSGEDGTDPTDMWIVLYEYPKEVKGYLVGYCPSSKEWCLIEKLQNDMYLCDIAGDESLAEALSNM